jgi:hypothetical protein
MYKSPSGPMAHPPGVTPADVALRPSTEGVPEPSPATVETMPLPAAMARTRLFPVSQT